MQSLPIFATHGMHECEGRGAHSRGPRLAKALAIQVTNAPA